MQRATILTHRTFGTGVCALTLLAIAPLRPVAAQPIYVQVNGAALNFGGAQPTRVGGRVLVPMRAIFEALGATVQWNPGAQTINAQRGATMVGMRIGQRSADVSGQAVMLDQPPLLYRGSTLVPLRFVGETLGAVVQWTPQQNTIFITAAPQPGTTTVGSAVTVDTPPPASLPDPGNDLSKMQVHGNFMVPVPGATIASLPRIRGTARALQGGVIARVGVQLVRSKGDKGYDYWTPGVGWRPQVFTVPADYNAAAGDWTVTRGLPTVKELPLGIYHINSIAYDQEGKPAFIALAGFTVAR
ncbi:MAG: copper amine oxidase N-terminal domain-containing protein [Armatimonadota bacterium]|nr:copper amine oxidase N-terminal domain-containing protein [Armatimonadota bacterium]